MKREDIQLISWSLFSQGYYSSEKELHEDVQRFVDRLSALPEEEQLLLIEKANTALKKL